MSRRLARIVMRLFPRIPKSAAVLLLATTVAAQQPDPTPPTFHVATDLLQIPVLVLSSDLRPLPPIDPARFVLSIAEGAPFHPTVRREADDPIALTLVIDTSGPQHELLSRLPLALSSSLASALHPQDTLAVDALDHCLLHHILPPSPANPQALSSAMQQAIAPPSSAVTHQRRDKCGNSVRLWDGLAFATEALSHQPGRRVLLALTNGDDTGSNSTWNQLRVFAGGRAVTLFALSDPEDGWRRHVIREVYRNNKPETDVLAAVCQLTGGLSMPALPDNLPHALLDFVAMVRNRYIVEFPRPEHFKASFNGLDVRVTGMHAFVRSSGIGFPPAEFDPTQTPVDRKQPRPVPGDRVILHTP